MKRKLQVIAAMLALAAVQPSVSAMAETMVSAAVPVPYVVEQPAHERLAGKLIGQSVRNPSHEKVGEITDLLFDSNGRITTAIIGVGGVLGIGEKSVGVPFGMLEFEIGRPGNRAIVLPLTKPELAQAPAFAASEKSTLEKAADEALMLENQAAKAIHDLGK